MPASGTVATYAPFSKHLKNWKNWKNWKGLQALKKDKNNKIMVHVDLAEKRYLVALWDYEKNEAYRFSVDHGDLCVPISLIGNIPFTLLQLLRYTFLMCDVPISGRQSVLFSDTLYTFEL